MKKAGPGFTLIELLVVIAIIAILAVVSLSLFGNAQKQAKDAIRLSDADQIRKALEIHKASVGSYPVVSDWVNIGNNSSFDTQMAGYLDPIPKDPDYPDKFYQYNSMPSGTGFKLFTDRETAADYIVVGGDGASIPEPVPTAPTPTSSTEPTSTPTTIPPTDTPTPTTTIPTEAPTSTPTIAPTFTPTPIPTVTPIPTPTPTPVVYKYVFITSGTYNGILGGLAGADTSCQTAANNAFLSGTYKAWLSSTTVSATSRIVHAAVAYKRVDNVVVANNWAQLVSGTLQTPISVTENNTTVSAGTRVWTNTTTAGNWITTTTANVCNNWANGNSTRYAYFGLSDSITSTWTQSAATIGCNNLYRLYCIGE